MADDPVAEAWQELYSLLETNHVGNTLIERDSGHMTLGDAVIALARRLATAKALAVLEEYEAARACVRVDGPPCVHLGGKRLCRQAVWGRLTTALREALEKEAGGG